jgi:ATP-dependent metalloprotease
MLRLKSALGKTSEKINKLFNVFKRNSNIPHGNASSANSENKISHLSFLFNKSSTIPEKQNIRSLTQKYILSNPYHFKSQAFAFEQSNKDLKLLAFILGALSLCYLYNDLKVIREDCKESLSQLLGIEIKRDDSVEKSNQDQFNMIRKSEAGLSSTIMQKLEELFGKKDKAKIQAKENLLIKSNVEERLSDVKGIDDVRDEIEEVIKILKNPQRYEDAGAKLMKGVLLVGRPGTGKTMLARALAGESGVNFIFTTASEFEHKLVGKGSTKIKNLFKKARENSPCIVFIDEIDSLLTKSKRNGKNSTSSERGEINTFLTQMDGFKKNEYVFVLGATNSINDLDEAALRPGRFDKIINVPLPDQKGRNEIFDLYLKKIRLNLQPDINGEHLSKMTQGFTGAEIENMVNLATILAVDKNSKDLSKSYFYEARDRLLLGIKLNKKKNDRQMLQRAIHEAGHSLVCYKLPSCRRNIHKVSIAKRGKFEGKTSILPDESNDMKKKDYFTFIQVAIAGLIAEEIYFGNHKVSVGCGSDLFNATDIAKDMVKKFGMSATEHGYMVIEDSSEVSHKISERTRSMVDVAADNFVKKATKEVREQLKDSMGDLMQIAKRLIEYEELTLDDLENIIDRGNDNLDKQKKRNVNNISDIVI